MERSELSSVAQHIISQTPLLVFILVPSPTLSQFPGSCKTSYWIFSNTTAYHWKQRRLSLHLTVSLLFYACSLISSPRQNIVCHRSSEREGEPVQHSTSASFIQLTLFPTYNSLEQSLSWEGSSSLNPEIPRTLRNPMFITVLAKALCMSQSWARPIQSTMSQNLSSRSSSVLTTT